MSPCIILRKTGTVVEIVVKDITGKTLFENYNDALEWLRKDVKVQRSRGNNNPTYSIVPIDTIGGITFEGDNMKILPKVG